MTEIKKSLASDTAKTTAMVAATLDFNRRTKLVALRLEGTILSEHTGALRDFLRNLSYFRGTRWTLQLKNLEVMSMRALKVLVKFVNVIRRRGYEVQVTSIQPGMLAVLMDLGLHELFAWQRLNRQYNFSRTEALDELPANTFPEEEVLEEKVYAF
jgi:anti-anti-sigma factor